MNAFYVSSSILNSNTPNSPLIRPEAIEAQRTKLLGEVVLVPRLSTFWLCLASCLIGIAVVALVILGSYTRRATVLGQLMPNAGVLRITAPQSGTVVQRKVNEGQSVKKGDVLFVLSSERFTQPEGTQAASPSQAQISAQIAQRQQSLSDDIARSQQTLQQERSYLERRLSTLKSEAQLIDKQIEQQRARLKVAEETRNRYQGLADKDYIAREQFTQKELELSEQQSRLQSQQRDLITNQREQASVTRDLQGLQARFGSQIAQLERGISNSQQELTEVESRRQVLITAPQDGQVSLLTSEVGQFSEAGKALMNLIPANTALQARLYVPSRHIGFVKNGDAVLLRYQAYPYQKFGQHRGTVISISTVPASSQELTTLNLPELAQGEPVYAIAVALQKQSIEVLGQTRLLQTGMRLEADMLQEKRKLWEWMLEPLYSMTEKAAQ